MSASVFSVVGNVVMMMMRRRGMTTMTMLMTMTFSVMPTTALMMLQLLFMNTATPIPEVADTATRSMPYGSAHSIRACSSS